MAKRGPSEVLLLVGGYDIGVLAHSLDINKSIIIEETTNFGVGSAEAASVGVSRSDIALTAYFDDADNKTSEALVGNEGTERVLVAGVSGNTQGRAMVGWKGATQMNSARTASRSELTKIATGFESSGDIEEGVIIQKLVADSGAGVTSDGSFDHGASGSRLAAYLQVTELTLGGYTSITVKVQESSDDGNTDAFADKVTFTNITADTTAERIVIGSTVERFTRVTLTLNGTGSGESITLLVAITT